jgi:hypothetical protein
VLGRSDLAIAYWLPDAERRVDLEGRRQAVDLSERGVTPVTSGRRRAALFADPPLDEGEDLSAPHRHRQRDARDRQPANGGHRRARAYARRRLNDNRSSSLALAEPST